MALSIHRLGQGGGPIAVAFVLLTLPIASLIWLRLGTEDSLGTANEERAPVIAPATQRTISEEFRVTVKVTLAEGQPLRAPAWTGTVATLRPAPVASSGAVLTVIDGVRRIALATPDPLYRNLGVGDFGSDVEQLNRALLALGYLEQLPDPVDEYRWSTVLGVLALAKELGVHEADGSFDTGWVIWLPKVSFQVHEWLLEAGDTSPAAGSIIGREPPVVTSATVAGQNAAEPLGLDPEVVWILAVGGVEVPVDPKSLTLAPEDAVALGPLVASDRDELSGVVRRGTPLQALAVPSTAVQTGSDGALCVWVADGATFRAVRVSVASARAGTTNVISGLSPTDLVLSNASDVLMGASCPSS